MECGLLGWHSWITHQTARSSTTGGVVHDFERCFLQPESVSALKAAGCFPLRQRAKHSPDPNVIEASSTPTAPYRARAGMDASAPPSLQRRPRSRRVAASKRVSKQRLFMPALCRRKPQWDLGRAWQNEPRKHWTLSGHRSERLEFHWKPYILL